MNHLKSFTRINKGNSNVKNIFKIFSNKKTFAESSNNNEGKYQTNFQSTDKDPFFPIKEIPQFENGLFKIFEYTEEPVKSDEKGEFQRLPQVPYEIKEHAMKGTVYTLFLTFLGRFLTGLKLTPIGIFKYKFFPHYTAGVLLYQTFWPCWYMYNAVTRISLTEDGRKVILEFKNGLKGKKEVEISKINKKREENFLMECYSEPFLFPIEIDETEKTGKYSLFNKKTVYLYGDSHKCIKHGEILRAVLNGQEIKLA